MMTNAQAREAIIGGIRRGLRRGALPAPAMRAVRERLDRHPRGPVPGRAVFDPHADLDTFMERVRASLATVDLVPDKGSVPGAVAAFLAGQNLAAEIALAPSPALLSLPWDRAKLLRVTEGKPGTSAMQEAFVAVAETATLVFPSGPTRPTLFNLLPDTQVALLRASRIVGAYEDAWDALRASGAMPRNVMFVTGPSRSADIEQTLELGAHGPRRLHVILVDDRCAAPV